MRLPRSTYQYAVLVTCAVVPRLASRWRVDKHDFFRNQTILETRQEVYLCLLFVKIIQ